jgi:hypothetical protein
VSGNWDQAVRRLHTLAATPDREDET